MDAKRLTAVGKALFPDSENWKADIAKILAVDQKTVRRWLEADNVKQGYEIALELLLKEKLGEPEAAKK